MSKRNKPRKKPKKPKSPQQAAETKDNSADREVPLVTQVPPSPNNRNQAQRPWYRTFEGWKVLLEIIAIPFAVGYAVVTFFQWRDLRNNFSVDERAWIKVEVGMPDAVEPNSLVAITARNVGKSPALKLHAGVTVQLVDADKAPALGARHEDFVANMMFASDFTAYNFPRTKTTPGNSQDPLRENPLNADEIRRLTTGEAYLAAFGIVAYEDQFGQHWTRFCVWKSYQTGPKDFHSRSCVAWNAVGDGSTKWESPSDTE